MKRIVVFIICIQSCLYLTAQQNLGIRNSNYAGIQGALLNPASIADSKLKWDVNVLSAGEVFANDFLYAPKSSLSFFGIKKIIDGSIHETLWQTHFDPENPNKLYNVSLSTEVLGPSFFFKVAKKHVFGVTVSGREYSNIKDITGAAAQNAFAYFLQSSLWNTNFQDQSAKMNSMGWIQYGLHYATVIHSNLRNELQIGISLNYLQGLGAAYFKNTHLNYRIGDTSNIAFTNSSIDYGRTAIDDFRNARDINHGHGLGADIGFTWVHFKEAPDDARETAGRIAAESDRNNYRYRIGVSLIDAGSIRFDKNTASYHLEAANANFANWHQSMFTDNAQLDRTLSAVFYNGDSSKSMTGNSFHMAMPTALSIQADWNVGQNYFVNATIVKGFGHGDNIGVVRPDVYSITPRFETRWWEISLPLSMIYYNEWKPRIGLAVRAGYFFIGGDAPGALFKLNDLTGVDFYAGVHFFMPERSKSAEFSMQ